jgi:trk system potassium uptake protein TrkH
MVENESDLPMTLQFYRSLTQWVGGIGVIVLTLTILARPGTGSYTLYRSEGREQKIRPSIVSTVRTIWWIFLLYTIIGIILIYVVGILAGDGVGIWESVNHCMTGLSTGGFSVTDNSLAHYSVAVRLVMIFLMVFGAIAFAAHYDLLNGKIRKFLSDVQTRLLLVLVVLGGLTLTFVNMGLYNDNFLLSLKESFFQFVSAISCTGFATTDLSMWGDSGLLVLSFAMILGGAAGSTAGGIKLFRGILLGKSVGWRTKSIFYPPRGVFKYALGGKSISKEEALDEVNEAAVISFLWLILLFLGVLFLAFTLPDEHIGNIIFEVCSAQGNVGLSTGITSMNMPILAKIMLILSMWIGRLEIIPILVLVRSIIRRKKIF